MVLTISALTSINALYAQWVLQNSGTNTILTDVVMLDTATAIAVGQDRSILRTSDAGTTWINVAESLSFVEPCNGVSFFDTANGIVVGDHGVVLTTSNGGKGWIWHQVPGGQKCLSALYVGPNSVYVGVDSGWIYHSLDSGTTWSSEKIGTEPIRSLFAWRGEYTLGLPIYALTPHSLYSKMEFSPTTWEETDLFFHGLGSAAFSGEYCNGGGAGFIVGVQGDLRSAPTILRKSISDTAWSVVSIDIPFDCTLLGVSAPSADVIYVCGTDGVILKSTNGGDTWSAAAVPTTRNLYAIYFFDEQRGFAVGEYGVILYTSNGGMTGIRDQESHLPVEFVLEQNYPNPFNPTTVINYQLPANVFVTLKVYDVLGRDIKTLASERQNAGTHSVTFNARNLPSGIYFYRLQAGTYSETKKLVVLK